MATGSPMIERDPRDSALAEMTVGTGPNSIHRQGTRRDLGNAKCAILGERRRAQPPAISSNPEEPSTTCPLAAPGGWLADHQPAISSGGMADHVVWDWNGTLWDDLPQVHLATNAALGEMGANPLGLSEYIRLFTRPLSLFYHRVLGRDLTDSEWERVNQSFLMSYESSLHLAGLATEVPHVLEIVARSGATQSILSLYPHAPLNSLVGRLGLAPYFTRIDGLRGPAGRSKVGLFGDHLRAAAPGIPPHRAVMIGDTDDDLAASQEAGSTCILVNHHGKHPLGYSANLDRFFAGGLLAALRKAGLSSGDGQMSPSESSGLCQKVTKNADDTS